MLEENRFFVEGGAVDWASHENLIGRLIEEETDFNNAVGAAVDWVKKHSTWDETLIIVTGDHETGYLHGPGSGSESNLFNPIINNGRRRLPGIEFYSTSHSNSLVPVFAKGGFSELFGNYATGTDPVRGAYIDNTDVFKVCLAALQETTNNQLLAAIYGLIDIITDETLRKDLKKSLINKVENALFQLSQGHFHAAINQLENFIKQIKAEQVRKNGISFNQASQLIEKAQNIIDMLTGNEKRVVSLRKAVVTESYSLFQNIPNPFNSYTTIEFIIPSGKSEQITLDIFDIRGVLVKTLADRVYGPGIHLVVWDGTNKAGIRVSSGIYLYILQAGEFTKYNKMILMK